MQFEVYQIIVPIVSLFFVVGLLRRFWMSKASWQETLIGGTFWTAVGVFALFPDQISHLIARVFGIKSNINAIIFLCLGLIFFFQYRLFFMIKRQEAALTQLVRRITLEREEKESRQ